MPPIVDHLNSIVRPSLRNFTAADLAFVAAQTAAAGVEESRQAVMLAARQAAVELHHFSDFVLTTRRRRLRSRISGRCAPPCNRT
jgi:hypothetical protein